MKALLMGYYGAGNLGDEMMLFCIDRWLKQQGVNITVLTEFPDRVRAQTGLPAVMNLPLCFQWGWRTVWLRGRAFRLIGTVLRHDMFIGGGGDLIRDDGGWKRFTFSVEKLILASLLGKRICLLNVGIGRPRSNYGRRLLQWTLKRCELIVVRDLRSWQLCREAGVADRTRYAPDIVSMLPEYFPDGTDRAPAEPYVIVALRSSANAFGRFDMTDARIANLAVALERVAARHDLKIVFLPFQSLAAQDDNAVHRRVAAEMRNPGRAAVQEWTGDLERVASVLRQARMVIAMRLHGAILGHALGRPCVTMPYDEKVSEFSAQAGIDAQLLPETLDDAARVEEVLERALRQAPHHSGQAPPHSWNEIELPGRQSADRGSKSSEGSFAIRLDH
jgi:polysaccharide pyruvyl transferase CsaB